MSNGGLKLKDNLAWIDLEMTGLEPERDSIVEAAVILTDGRLLTTIDGPELVIAADEAALAQMDPFVRDMHTTSGLLDRVRGAGIELAEAEATLVTFIEQHVGDDDVLLAGNSVHTDRAFIHRHMPRLDALLHYRHVDVSTVKELARRWAPLVFEGAPPKDGGHRALADIRESIEELRYYRRALFSELAQERQ